MAEPIAYNVSYSFSGFQASNPAAPLPASPVDIEFAGIEASIASVIDALGDVRRSDGGIQNGAVTLESLDDALREAVGSDHDILVTDLDPAAIATQADAEAGAVNGVLMTPLRTKQALDAQRAFASQAEAQAGVDAVTVVSPLRVKEALDALRAFASQAEAEAGVDTTKVMSSLRVKEALDAQRPVLHESQLITWGAMLTLAADTQTITVTGAEVGDRVVVGYPAAGVDDGLVMRAWVSAADTVSLRLYNTTAGSITPTGGLTWHVTVIKTPV